MPPYRAARAPGYTTPSTRGPRAPVTAGRLPGRPASVSRASHANPMASTKSGSTPCAAVDSTRHARQARARSGQQHAGCARRRRRPARGACPAGAPAARRRRVVAVSSSRVACTSCGARVARAVGPAPSRGGTVRGRCSWAAAMRTTARRSRRASSAASTRTAGGERAAARRKASPRWRSHQASSSAFAGPVSKPRTCAIARQQREVGDAAEVEHRAVFVDASCSNAAWKAGTSGAPWPPAATSRRRKSATVVDAGAFGDDVAVAELPGERRCAACGSVADGLAMRADRADLASPRLPASRATACAASANASRPARRGRRARRATCTSPPWPSATRRARRLRPSARCGRATSSQARARRRRSAPARHRCRRRWCRRSGQGRAAASDRHAACATGVRRVGSRRLARCSAARRRLFLPRFSAAGAASA